MHEFGLAKSIVDTVIQVAEDHSATQILGVNLEVGEVALVNMDQMGWYLEMLTQDTIAQGMQVHVTKIPVRIRCNDCGYEGAVRYKEEKLADDQAIPLFECIECNSSETVIIAGRELHIKDINVKFDSVENGEEGKDGEKGG